jgi:AcrR family transcriptional regulator
MAADKLPTKIRKDQLAQAALSLVGLHGLKALSVARVAHRVGVVPSAVYRHFSGKEELLDAVVQLIQNRLLSNVARACEGAPDSVECLKRLIHMHAQLIRENQGIPRIIFSEEIFAGSASRKAAVFETVQSYLGRVAEIVRRGQQEGSIRRDLDPGTVSMMLLGVVQPGAILWQLSDGRVDVTKHAERGWQILSEAIRPK